MVVIRSGAISCRFINTAQWRASTPTLSIWARIRWTFLIRLILHFECKVKKDLIWEETLWWVVKMWLPHLRKQTVGWLLLSKTEDNKVAVDSIGGYTMWELFLVQRVDSKFALQILLWFTQLHDRWCYNNIWLLIL